MKLKINFSKNHYLLIALFDNTAVTRWFKHFANCDYVIRWESMPPLNHTYVNTDLEWTNLLQVFSTLSTLGYHPNIVVPETFDRSQKTLNLLHRFFTYNAIWGRNNLASPNKYDEKFQLPKHISFEEWWNLIDEINNCVHRLERIVPHQNFVTQVNAFEFVPNSKITLDWLEFTQEELKHNYEYLEKKSQFKYLVLLDKSILGKCVLQSFANDDDPTADDCTGRLGSHGGFVVEIDGSRKTVYQSDQFQQWISKHGLSAENLPYDFPIGYVEQQSFVLHRLGLEYVLESIDFIP
jgi:hypothetical protein